MVVTIQGVMKKPTGMLSKSEGSTPSSGVVILPKSEASTPQQKVGVVRREPTLPGRPAGVLKPATAGRTCILPRPLGVLKTTTSTPPITTTPRTATPLVRCVLYWEQMCLSSVYMTVVLLVCQSLVACLILSQHFQSLP